MRLPKTNQQRQNDYIRRMTGGTLGGRVRSAAPIAATAKPSRRHAGVKSEAPKLEVCGESVTPAIPTSGLIHDYDIEQQPEALGENVSAFIDSGSLGWDVPHDSGDFAVMDEHNGFKAVLWPPDRVDTIWYEISGVDAYWSQNFTVMIAGVAVGGRDGPSRNPGIRRFLEGSYEDISNSELYVYQGGMSSTDFMNTDSFSITEQLNSTDYDVQNSWYYEVYEDGDVLAGGRFMGEHTDDPGRGLLYCTSFEEPTESNFNPADLGYVADLMRIEGDAWKTLRILMWNRALSDDEMKQVRAWFIDTYGITNIETEGSSF